MRSMNPASVWPVALVYVDGLYVSASGTTVCHTQWKHWLVAESFEEALDRRAPCQIHAGTDGQSRSSTGQQCAQHRQSSEESSLFRAS